MQKLKKLVRHLIMAGFIGLSAFSGWQLSTSTGGRIFIERSQSELQERLVKFAADNSDKATLEKAISSELDIEPRNWVVINSLLEIAENQEIPLSEGIQESLENADASDNSFLNTTTECVRCAWDTSSCQLSKAMACGLTVNMTPIGDVAGIARAGTNYWQGEDIDEIDAALSIVGLGASAMSIGSGGTSLTLKAGAGLLKFAHLSGNIPAPIARVLRTAAREGVDWAGLRAIRGVDDLKSVMRIDALTPAVNASSSIGEIVSSASVAQGLYLLRVSENVSELRSISRTAAVWKNETAGFIRLVGKNRVVRASFRLAGEVYALAVGLVGLLVSIFWTMISLAGDRVARRMSRRAQNTAGSR